jgi:hypothetical protein
MTTTHTHVIEEFANPFLRCDTCGEWVLGWVRHEGQVPECQHLGQLYPCGHVGATSVCPSWSPVDGCRCLEHLGSVDHPPREHPGGGTDGHSGRSTGAS